MQTLHELARDTGQLLHYHALLLATAESCTGGMIAAAVTSVPGSSAWFERGWVTYSNQAKMDDLGVTEAVLDKEGAVSEATVLAMAKGAIARSQAHVSIAISGIAGPSGGTQEKPVGTVWIAWGQKLGYAEAEHFVFDGDRQQVREAAARIAMKGVLRRLSKT